MSDVEPGLAAGAGAAAGLAASVGAAAAGAATDGASAAGAGASGAGACAAAAASPAFWARILARMSDVESFFSSIAVWAGQRKLTPTRPAHHARKRGAAEGNTL
jgi:hypothetical protein